MRDTISQNLQCWMGFYLNRLYWNPPFLVLCWHTFLMTKIVYSVVFVCVCEMESVVNNSCCSDISYEYVFPTTCCVPQMENIWRICSPRINKIFVTGIALLLSLFGPCLIVWLPLMCTGNVFHRINQRNVINTKIKIRMCVQRCNCKGTVLEMTFHDA